MNRFYSICDDNKYFPSGNNRTDLLSRYKIDEIPRLCNLPGNPHRCEYSSIGKSLISNTIIAASFLILSIFLIYSHLLINQFKYKTHLFIAVSTIVLLSLGLILILTSLIILGSTMSYDLFEYKFNFEFALAQKGSRKSVSQREYPSRTFFFAFSERLNQSRNFERTVRQSAATDFDIRLDWSAGLEIISLVLTSFTLVTQILYLFSTYRNRIG